MEITANKLRLIKQSYFKKTEEYYKPLHTNELTHPEINPVVKGSVSNAST